MLSIIKRRNLQKAETEVVGLTWASQGSKDGNGAVVSPPKEPSREPSRLVSHIPPPVSVSVSSLGTGSTTSSISSAQFHPFQSLSRKGDDETHDGEPPQSKPTVVVAKKVSARVDEVHGHESSASVSQFVLQPSPETFLPPTNGKLSGFKRTISFVSVDTKTSAFPQNKRTCLDKPPSPIPPSGGSQAQPKPQQVLLLATSKDSPVLSPLHIFVRQQIEVFEASEEDLKQPAPGRRIPIQLRQVGLRCIHCKHQKPRERKKRAVCYPSSVGRVYHSVSDMKFAHFPCSQMPQGLHQKFNELKDESVLQNKSNKESKRIGSASASTAQYYHDSARELGLEDGKGGIYVSSQSRVVVPDDGRQHPSLTFATMSQHNALQSMLMGNLVPAYAHANAVPAAANFKVQTMAPKASASISHQVASSVLCKETRLPLAVVTSPQDIVKEQAGPQEQSKSGKAHLASEMDKHYLAPIHCFVRRHVEVFAANEQDLAAPAPGRKKPIVLGQVGLRCMYCARLPIKDRVKRAICFPPSVGGVYHAVSNMKFDHFKQCKGMPKEAREEFQQLVSSPNSSEGKRSRVDSAPRPRVSNSTAQYYHDSALRMGLCDTSEGIRFRQPQLGKHVSKKGEEVSVVPEGMEALILAATDPAVRAAHELKRSSPKAG
ncbi:expressed unknown protein [Seminavis robusta]|uniref:Uncharacterized protein n=1 Tax=Seminavis robusta TaxID=568900 RepID=A0A9N8H9M0_9STRA|nr:expressed unknown protein [Seminavis robusta]|eukprot:Sro196_g083550.1 n/a (658) ;mRNA; r:55751-57724